MEELNNVKIEGYRGKWHSIDSIHFGTHTLYLMEHDYYDDETEGLIIDENNRLICDDVWNGFDDFYERYDYCIIELYEYNVPPCVDERIDFIIDKMYENLKGEN